MADVDEDAIDQPSASTSQDAAGQVHEDISDETQDFRFINSFSLYGSAFPAVYLPVSSNLL